MTVLASTAILGLAWFAAVNAVMSAVCWLATRVMREEVLADARRSRRLLVLRFLPSVTAAIVSCALFVPAHFRLEPVNPDERYGVVTITLACAAVLLLLRSAWRLGRIAFVSTRLSSAICCHETQHGGVTCVDLPLFQGIALAGTFRPRVLIGSGARQALTSGELDVAIAHEVAHQRVGDNLTRLLMMAAPDFLAFTPASARLERLWGAEAECLADARAAGGNVERARKLASALIKVSRLARADDVASAAWSLFHQPALIETRIHLLLKRDCDRPIAVSRAFEPLLLAAVAAVTVAWAAGLPRELHALTEVILVRLP